MAIITITSDLGTRDFYLAALKGAIITNSGRTEITDITHAIKPFDIKEAAFTVRNAFRYFPKGTIHLVHVSATERKDKLLVAVIDGHYFITFDNGFLSLAFDKMPHQIYQVNEELLASSSLLYEDAIGKVINLLVKEFTPADFGQLTTDTLNFRLMQPITSPGSIRGTIANIDNFGNAIVNVTKTMFGQFIGEKSFTILANIGSVKNIEKDYGDVEEGEFLALFNSAGYLELAINKGRADNLLGLHIDSPVLILID